MNYTKITKAQFDEMQFNAGVLVRSFSIENPAITDEDIVCATTGGFSIAVEPSYVDLGDGVYMMPPGTAEMIKVTGWTVDASFTALGFGKNLLRFMLGAADTGAADTSDSINPRLELQDADFSNLWWIGDRVDGGLVAIHILNALSDEGVDIQTERQRAGQISVHLTAHASLEDDMDAVPVEIYSVERKPFFDVVQHQFLFVYNADNDLFELDESTGNLYITEGDKWAYTLDVESGTMEVDKHGV